MELINEFKRNRRAEVIQDSIDLEEKLISDGKMKRPYEDVSMKYHERCEYTLKQKYNRIYHFGEVFNRMMCLEQNKPSLDKINKIKGLLKSHDKTSIYKACNYNQREHLNYIYCVVTNLELPKLTREIAQQTEIIKYHIRKFYNNSNIKSIKYRLVIDVICEKFGFTKIRKLFFL